MTVTKEAIEAAWAAYQKFGWSTQEGMGKALEAALPFLPIAGEGKEFTAGAKVRVKDTGETGEIIRCPLIVQADEDDGSQGAMGGTKWIGEFEAAQLELLTPPSSPGKDGGQEVEAVVFPDVVSWTGNVHDRDTALTGLANYLEDCCKFNPVRGRQIWAMKEAAKLLRFFAEKSPLYTHPQPASTALVERQIRKAGQVAIDELIERMDGKHPGDDDLADYLTRIVDACARTALSASQSTSSEGDSRG